MLPALKPLSSLKSLYLVPMSAAQSSQRPIVAPAASGPAPSHPVPVRCDCSRREARQYHGLEHPHSIIHLTFSPLRTATPRRETTSQKDADKRIWTVSDRVTPGASSVRTAARSSRSHQLHAWPRLALHKCPVFLFKTLEEGSTERVLLHGLRTCVLLPLVIGQSALLILEQMLNILRCDRPGGSAENSLRPRRWRRALELAP